MAKYLQAKVTSGQLSPGMDLLHHSQILLFTQAALISAPPKF